MMSSAEEGIYLNINKMLAHYLFFPIFGVFLHLKEVLKNGPTILKSHSLRLFFCKRFAVIFFLLYLLSLCMRLILLMSFEYCYRKT